jgi:hypothetical protein
MVKMTVRNIGEYGLWGEGLEKAEELHLLTAQFRDELLTNHTLQNLLLNHGDPLDEKQRPASYFDIMDPTWNRRFIVVHLSYLERVIELATLPQIAGVSRAAIDKSGKTALVYPDATAELPTKLQSPEGFDSGSIETLQREWFENIDIVPKIMEYGDMLRKAFDEYNLKLVLIKMQNCQTHMFFDDCKEKRLHDRIKKTGGPYSAMDSAYYNMGNRFFKSAGSLWEELSATEFGKMFCLTQEEVDEAIKLGQK